MTKEPFVLIWKQKFKKQKRYYYKVSSRSRENSFCISLNIILWDYMRSAELL